MSTYDIIQCPDITIASGDTDSNVVKGDEVYNDAYAIILYGPSVLDPYAFTIYVSPNPEADTPYWAILNDNVSDINAPPANRAIVYESFSAKAFKIVSSTAVSGDMTWKMSKRILFGA
jgi:hypothetical protein